MTSNAATTPTNPKPLSLMGRMHARWAYAPRIAELTRRISEKLQPNWRVLDVGCGSGALGASVKNANPELHVEGIDVMPRQDCPIPVVGYKGGKMPIEDNAFDAVICADVLHHEKDPLFLLKETARVAKEMVIVKDHVIQGLFAKSTISFLDWGANAPHGVPCLYEYNKPDEWEKLFQKAGLEIIEQTTKMKLYAWWLNPIFSRRLHILSFLKPKNN